MTAQTFKQLSPSAVHVPTADDKDKKGGKSFRAFIGQTPVAKRNLHPHDEKTAKTPFLYDVNSLGSLRPDQVPRFFGALTDSKNLPDADVKLSDLHAMQDRVDPAKVEAMRGKDLTSAKRPVVIRHNDKHYIADGHHRLAADWMDGKESSPVKLLDLTEVSNALKARESTTEQFKVCKVDETAGVVFGWAIVSKKAGADYYDWNVDHHGEHKGKLVPEHITEKAMFDCGLGFALSKDRAGNIQHDGPDVGTYPFIFPLTADIAKAMGIECDTTGLMVGYKPCKDTLAKFADGTLTGFSIEGWRMPGGSETHA
jgi:hypothetical protein